MAIIRILCVVGALGFLFFQVYGFIKQIKAKKQKNSSNK